ncbi:CCA tRNA nucleotidyltransferase [Shimia abyssi]|uniref:Poly(A) polymerase n=1 Tax=Shimia abyssi TaxID=1662395 RepID=A0A2P8F8D8_9RHOB|nr:CCA tRNA nucleotidyltransferase [Shimia abyssi]PSL17984.1 poly(A) polymerase [Shimia abyssi]
MKINGDWLTKPATQHVCAMLTLAGHQAFFVGGCVRNALLGAPVNDIDISTDALPAEVISLAKSAGLNAIPTGIDHGTVTVVSGGIPHEITTFRKDVETDGRRAVVAFSKNVKDDARRRDFTMNALYADADGLVLDPLGGMADLEMRHVRFIDDANQRIREDYLRILRYFRFHAFYGDPESGMDADALSAIANNIDGLSGLSRERIGYEVLRLLGAPDPAPAVAAMRSVGALGAVLTGTDDRALAPLIHIEGILELEPDPMRRLAAIGGEDVPTALRLSRKQTHSFVTMRDAIGVMQSPAALGYRHGSNLALSIAALQAAVLEASLLPDLRKDIESGARAIFPIKPVDLMPTLQGPALGAALKDLEAIWIASSFSLDRAALLASLKT